MSRTAINQYVKNRTATATPDEILAHYHEQEAN